ncbi:MAG: tyrosine-protein phosphatase [Maricaulaceae bacterium]
MAVWNEHEISPGVWRSNQPTPRRIRLWADRGIKTVVNLRNESPKAWYALEADACARFGVELVNFAARSRAAPEKAWFHDVKALFAQVEPPFVMHCKSGADRAGLMSALYLLIAQNRPVEEAAAQLSWRYLHVRQGKTGILDFLIDEYARSNALHSMSFLDWVDERYDPTALRAAFQPAPLADFVVDRVLRRE